METFKLRKLYGTGVFKIICLCVLFLFFALYFFIPWNTKDEKVFKVDNKIIEKTTHTVATLNFKGEKVNTINFNKQYAEVIYKEEEQEISHFIDLNEGKEIEITELLSDKEAFNNKIHELLLLVYPKKIVGYLEESTPRYIFRNNELNIYYDISDKVQTTRSFYLTVDYNEIHDYLKFPVELNESYKRMSGYDYDPNKTTIAFTFDDGPNGNRTRTLINTLEDYKMSATFFMLGSGYATNADLVKTVYDSHSEVGYHNYTHTYYTKEHTAQIQNEFKLADDAFYSITGDHIKLTRPPYGSYNQETLEALDTPLIRWNLDTNDWRYKELDYLRSYVLDNYSDGAIILFHDTYDTSITAATSLMETLYLMDVQVVNVSELAKIQGIELESHMAYYSLK